jgi:phosphoglycerol geranylgeranyltransferase
MKDTVYNTIQDAFRAEKKLYWVLLDPDDYSPAEGRILARGAAENGADAVLVGGSLMNTSYFDEFVSEVQADISLPVILFPGDASQVSSHADALLFLTLVSGRNPNFLIGEQVKGAPGIKNAGIEPIATAYMLIESGNTTSVEFMSNTKPIPRNKPDIAGVHALAAQYMGQKLIYLEAGSGAVSSVPAEIISAVKSQVDVPVIVGGGIRTEKDVHQKLSAGADIIVTGTVLTQDTGAARLARLAQAVKNY